MISIGQTRHVIPDWTISNRTSDQTGQAQPQTRLPSSDWTFLFQAEHFSRHAATDQTTSDRTASDQISKLRPEGFTPDIPAPTWQSGWTWKSRANALPLTKHSSSESHGLRPNIKTQTGHASSDLTSQLRLVSFGQDLQVQGERPQPQTRHPRSGRIPTQIQRPRTGHPCSDRTVTASGQTYKFTPDMRAQPGQP